MGTACKRAIQLMQQLELLDRAYCGLADVPEELAWYNHLGNEIGGEWVESPSDITTDPVKLMIIRKQRAILSEIREILGVNEELQMHREDIYREKIKRDYAWAKGFGLTDNQVAIVLGENTRYIMRIGAEAHATMGN